MTTNKVKIFPKHENILSTLDILFLQRMYMEYFSRKNIHSDKSLWLVASQVVGLELIFVDSYSHIKYQFSQMLQLQKAARK